MLLIQYTLLLFDLQHTQYLALSNTNIYNMHPPVNIWGGKPTHVHVTDKTPHLLLKQVLGMSMKELCNKTTFLETFS